MTYWIITRWIHGGNIWDPSFKNLEYFSEAVFGLVGGHTSHCHRQYFLCMFCKLFVNLSLKLMTL